MAKVLKRNVTFSDDSGRFVTLMAGTKPTKEQEKFITNEKVYQAPAEGDRFVDPDLPAGLQGAEVVVPEDDDEDEEDDGSPNPPPMSGKGSGLEAWVSYLKELFPDAEVNESDTRESVIEYLRSQGAKVDR